MCVSTDTKIKLFIPAGAAAPTPPFGPILGQYGINTVQFCKDFNEATGGLVLYFDDEDGPFDLFGGFILSVNIAIKEDRTYSYTLSKPPVSFLLRTLTGVRVGAPTKIAGTISASELVFLAQFKMPDESLASACKILAGTARSIGVRVLG